MNLNIEEINNALVLNGLSIKELAKRLNVQKKDIVNFMRNNGFTYSNDEGYFIKAIDVQEDLLKRVKDLEQQQIVILELLSNTNEVNKELDLDICTGEITQKSYKLSKATADKFSEFCKRNRKYKVQDLLTLALEEFMEKNKCITQTISIHNNNLKHDH